MIWGNVSGDMGAGLQGDYNATAWPQLAKPGLALARTVGLGPECGN